MIKKLCLQLAVTVSILGGAWSGGAHAQDQSQVNLSGTQVYEAFCIICHGPRGQGSPLGLRLISPVMKAKTDQEIITGISVGNLSKGMSAFGGSLTKGEIYRVMTHVRSLQGKEVTLKPPTQSTAQGQTSGDRAEGEALFNGKGRCIRCHSYFNHGGVKGPNLEGIGARMSLEELSKAVITPSQSVSEGYEGKEIKTRDGKTIRGRFRNETEESVQLLNRRGDLWTTHVKAELEQVRDMEDSLMPDATSDFSDAERASLFSFLEGLK